MLNQRDLNLEGVEQLCQADMTWKLVPLYYCPGKEKEACIVFVCSQLAVLMFSSSSTSFQTELFTNGNKVVSYLIEHGESGIHSPLFLFKKPDCATCLIHLMHYCNFLSPTLLSSSEPFQVGLLACGLFCRHLWDE